MLFRRRQAVLNIIFYLLSNEINIKKVVRYIKNYKIDKTLT